MVNNSDIRLNFTRTTPLILVRLVISTWYIMADKTQQQQPEPSECTIKVFSRFRPQSEAETRSGGEMIVKFPTTDTVIHSGRTFTFDRVFKPTSTQEKVYMEAAQAIVQGKVLP